MTELRQVLRDIEVFRGELPVFDPRTAPETPAELFTE
jgi:pyridoxamine 5'-phosphate oxidase